MLDILNGILHIDTYLVSFVVNYGKWVYFALFLILFCETGLIVTPFLPGDSLLFAAGSIAAQTEIGLNLGILLFSLFTASILGNQVNYWIGRTLGIRLISSNHSWLFNKNYLEKTHRFYEQHGGKTIIFARFIPIIRSFAPFIAGITRMDRKPFLLYNITSALAWIGSLVSLGYFFGSLPIIKEHFSLVIYGIVALSLLLPVISFLCRKLRISRPKLSSYPIATPCCTEEREVKNKVAL